jgi:polysaccharide biosynthesis protein PslG
MFLQRIALYCLIGSTIAVRAGDLPEAVFPAGVGVNIHFVTGHQKDLDLISAAGFKWIRMDFDWAQIERKTNEFDWSAYDELTANLEKRGMRAIYILDYSNPLYEEKVVSTNPLTHQSQTDIASPQRPESVTAFGRWAAAAATHFRGKPILWEIWNEPNISFWKPKPNARQYADLALATCKAIREANPKAGIIGPACSTFDWPFLQRFLESGVLQYLDAVSVHPYRPPNRSPETAAVDYQKLRELIEQLGNDDHQKKVPIVCGEWGYSSHQGGVSPETQAAFIARQQLSNLLNGVPLSIWYDWMNDGPDPRENEHNFGTMTHDLQPKPAYVAIRTLTRALSGCRILRRIELGEQDYVLVCVDSSGGCKLAAWTTAEPHTVSFDLPYASAQLIAAVNSDGTNYIPKRENDRLVMDLSAAPKYVMMR